MKSLSFGHKVLFVINNLFAICLLLSYIAPYLAPTIISFPAFLGLAYPILLLINLCFVIYWIIRLKSQLLLSLICMAIGYHFIPRFYQSSGSFKAMASDNNISLVSYNTYGANFLGNNDEKRALVHKEINRLIDDASADIVCFQETSNNQRNKKKFPYSTSRFKSMILSKYPIVNEGYISFEEGSYNTCIYADIKMPIDTIRIYNVHLASLKFKAGDYEFINKIDENLEEEKLKAGSYSLFQKIGIAFKKRSLQAEKISAHAHKSPHPVVLCGDFNDTAASYAYEQLSANYTDAFVTSGSGMGTTYQKLNIPLRIDFILYDKEHINAFNFNTIYKELSDHYPIHANLEIK